MKEMLSIIADHLIPKTLQPVSYAVLLWCGQSRADAKETSRVANCQISASIL